MVIATLIGFFTVAPTVSAATTSVSTNAARYVPGETVVITATGFTGCGGTISFRISPPGNNGSPTTLTAPNSSGTATVNFVAPNRPGNWRVQASATGCAPATTTFVINRPVYPPALGSPLGTQVDVDSSSVPPGGTIVITASGFEACAGQTITFTITPPNGQPTVIQTSIASPVGVAETTYTATTNQGTYTVVASSTGCVSASSSFTVRALPATGSDSYSWLNTAGIAAVAGLGLVVVARRRRRPAAA